MNKYSKINIYSKLIYFNLHQKINIFKKWFFKILKKIKRKILKIFLKNRKLNFSLFINENNKFLIGKNGKKHIKYGIYDKIVIKL